MVELSTEKLRMNPYMNLALHGDVDNSHFCYYSYLCGLSFHILVHSLEHDRELAQMESSKETGCQAPEGPILCVNNCGFFGSAATMNMCSKCHKDIILKQQQAKLAATSIENIVNGSSSSNQKEPVLAEAVKVEAGSVELKTDALQPSSDLVSGQSSEPKPKEGPNRCTACRKRVGLTGFNCKCGNLFCSVHRYSDKHECPFDYRTAGRDAIAKANPLVKADKLDKI
ncbi:UNVERIFIED_CONTAM: Zinc finger A20 and AN1 domain-containing stress-associated protein 8 [Sesamum radiatum]|uniref:Zinc finger A20 and AN1 domain-containing stress-associated protein 8 n=2 Tax=Sesamum TaxID=4181 RepID=A0AAW2LCU4_SESRA